MRNVLLAVLLAISASASVPSLFAGSDLTFAILGDAGKVTSNSKAVLNSILKEKVISLILPGDNLYSSTYERVWDNWRNANLSFDVVAIGNHHGGYQKEMEYFEMPAEFYSRTYADDMRFIVLNSDNEKNVSQQMTFLQKELEDATEKNVFLVYHHPSFTLSHFHRWDEKAVFQRAIRPLLKKYRSRITALLVGHDHLAMISEFDDLPVILSGAVQEVRIDTAMNNVQDSVKVSTPWFFDRKAYWAKLALKEDQNSVDIEFIRAADHYVQCTVTLKKGVKMKLDPNCEKND